jgi:hypothetical protein
MGRRTRRILERFATVVCPPELVGLGLLPSLVTEFEAQVACLPPAGRRLVMPTLRVLDQVARVRGGGRPFVRLADARADAYLRRLLYARTGPLATAVRLVKTLVVLCYFELPEVRRALGYDPGPYIATVTARRRATYGPQIEAAERDALLDAPPGAP